MHCAAPSPCPLIDSCAKSHYLGRESHAKFESLQLSVTRRLTLVAKSFHGQRRPPSLRNPASDETIETQDCSSRLRQISAFRIVSVEKTF